MNIKNQYKVKKKLNKHEKTIRGIYFYYFTSQLFKFPPKHAKNCAELVQKRVLGGSL